MNKKLKNVYVKGNVYVKDDILLDASYISNTDFNDLIIEGDLYIFGVCYINGGVIGSTNIDSNESKEYERIKGDFFLGKEVYIRLLKSESDIIIKPDLSETKLRKEKIKKIFNE